VRRLSSEMLFPSYSALIFPQGFLLPALRFFSGQNLVVLSQIFLIHIGVDSFPITRKLHDSFFFLSLVPVPLAPNTLFSFLLRWPFLDDPCLFSSAAIRMRFFNAVELVSFFPHLSSFLHCFRLPFKYVNPICRLSGYPWCDLVFF